MSLPDPTAELASLVARAAYDRGGINPVLVDVTSKLALADAFVVVSAPTDRQVRAITEDIMDRLWAEHGRRPTHIEGRAEGTWVLLDYSELLVHVLSEEERDYYALERLWGDCPRRRSMWTRTRPARPRPSVQRRTARRPRSDRVSDRPAAPRPD